MTGPKRLTILQLNDVHGYLDLHQEIFWHGQQAVYRPAGGYARIATLIKHIRAETEGRALLCDCGDTLHGTFAVVSTQGQAVLPILNTLHFDAMTGHWEFAYGPKRLEERVTQLRYPMLAINVYDKKTGERPFPPYLVKEIAGLRIGVIGIASNIVDKTMPPSYSEGLRFTLGRDELPLMIANLRSNEKVDLIVLLSHLGFPQDMKLLSEVQGIDVCLSSHTHNRLYAPVLNGDTLVIQSGCHGSFLGRLDVQWNGRIVDFQHQLIEIDAAIPPDPDVAVLVNQALSPHEAFLSEKVGHTATALNRATMLESTMDNLLLLALQESTGAQLAFSNGWRYGAPIAPGTITLNDLYNIIPMNPPASMVELTGAEVWAMLEENLERTFSPDAYQQMGGYVKRCLGLNVYFKVENPAGQRIHEIFIENEKIQHDGTYMAAFVTQQGVPQHYGTHRENLPLHAIDALRSYVANHQPLQVELMGTFTMM